MCSCGILNFASPEKFKCVLYIFSSWSLFLEIVLEVSLKKPLLEKKNRYFTKIAYRLLLNSLSIKNTVAFTAGMTVFKDSMLPLCELLTH